MTEQQNQFKRDFGTEIGRRFLKNEMGKQKCIRALVVVKWSACSPSTPMIRIWIPPKPTVFFCKICVWKEHK